MWGCSYWHPIFGRGELNMAATTDSSSREARRRRIVERGADRLALITGRIQTLPSLPTELPHHDDPIVSLSTQDKASSFELPYHDSSVESEEMCTDDGKSKAEAILPKLGTSAEALRALYEEEDVPVQSSHATRIVQEEQRLEPQGHLGRLFTPKRINSAIGSTESTRLFCSLAGAILVAFSYIGVPIFGNSFMKSIIYFRPFYLVLIAGVSVVLKRLILDEQGVVRAERETSYIPSVGGYGSVEQLGRALELFFCFKNITNAVFMDFSVYSIVLVCGIAFAQKLG